MKLHFFSDYSIIILSMKKVKHILAVFFHSFIPQDIYYPKLLHTRFSFSLKYYIVIVTFFACVFAGIVFSWISPVTMGAYKDSIVHSLLTFPDDVKITVQNGVMESNQDKPFFLWIYHDDNPLFVFMAHTRNMSTESLLPHPLFFMGPDSIKFSHNGKMVAYPYDSSLSLSITKERLIPVVKKINTLFPLFMIILYVMIISIIPLLFVGGISLCILISSFLIYLLLRTFIPSIHLKKCIQACMHGTHIPLIIALLLYALFPNTANILIITAAHIFVFGLVSTYEMYSKRGAHVKGR